MALPNYPNNPTAGQQFTVGNNVYEFDGEKWKALSNADNSLRSQLADADSSVLVGGVKASNLSSRVRDIRDFGVTGDGSDETATFQAAVDASSKLLIPSGLSITLAGVGNNVLINKNNFELVIETGAEIVKEGTGAALFIGSDGGNYENITIRGGGLIRNPTNSHPTETTAILVGSSTETLTSVCVKDLKIEMSKYGVASGSQSTTLVNFVATNLCAVVNVDGWAAGNDVAQPFEFNLPNSLGESSACITDCHFRINNTTSTRGDAFKFTNCKLKASNLNLELAGQGQTVCVFSSMKKGSKIHNISAQVLSTSGSIEDAVQINNSEDASFSNINGETGTLFGGGIQLGNLTRCQLNNITTNQSIRQSANTTIADSTIDGFVASTVPFTQAGSSFVGGAIRNGKSGGQIFLQVTDCDIESITADVAGVSVRGFYIKGNSNRVRDVAVIDSASTYAFDIEGDDNEIQRLVLDDCNGSWRVISGSNNRIGRISYPSPTSGNFDNFLDNGTNTSHPILNIGGLTGSVSLSVPNNPDGSTTIELTFLSGATTITNITGAQDKDRVTIFQTGASNAYTIPANANFALAGGVDFTGNQYDVIELVYSDVASKWVEVSRSINS